MRSSICSCCECVCLCIYRCECLCFNQIVCVCVWVNLHLGTGKWADVSIPESVHVFVCLHVFILVYVYFCACLSEWALSGAAPCCASCIWSHLCWGLSGRGADDFNVLEPQTDLSQTVVSMKPRQLGPVKLNRLIWVVSRRQTLWLHCNPPVRLTREPLAVRCRQTLESVCSDDKTIVFCIRGHVLTFSWLSRFCCRLSTM